MGCLAFEDWAGALASLGQMHLLAAHALFVCIQQMHGEEASPSWSDTASVCCVCSGAQATPRSSPCCANVHSTATLSPGLVDWWLHACLFLWCMVSAQLFAENIRAWCACTARLLALLLSKCTRYLLLHASLRCYSACTFLQTISASPAASASTWASSP
jgi:hypothetical protein